MQHWWQRLGERIDREYERRIRRASQLSDSDPAQHQEPSAPEPEDEAIEIVNVPRGTQVIHATDEASGAGPVPSGRP